MSETTSNRERPQKELVLRGVRVLAFTTGWAGPMAGEVLGDFGADVIKVESCRHVDWGRGVAIVRGKGDETRDKLWEWGTTFAGANENTRSVTLDLTTSQGKELFRQLVAVSDVVIENFAPRVLKQLGITYDQLRRINPSIILVSMPAFGNWGPWGDYVGYAQTTESTGGVAALCGYEGESPVLQGDPYGDPLAGINGAMAALMALRHRRRTGQGQSVEVSHVEAITPHIGGPLMDYVMNGRIQPRRGNRSPVYAPHGCYRAAGDDSWVVITVTSETEWQALCSAMGRPDVLADPRFRTMKDRLANQDALDAIVQEWTSPLNRFHIMRTLQGAGVPAGPVLDAADLLANEHLAATGFFVPLHKEPVGTHPYPGIAPRLNVTPGEKRMAAPTLGEHNGEVLGALLGVSPADLRLLEEAQVIGYEPLEAGERVPSRPG